MKGSRPPLDTLESSLREGVAEAIRDSHARGIPVFEADDTMVYAVYPDGRRVAVERLTPKSIPVA